MTSLGVDFQSFNDRSSASHPASNARNIPQLLVLNLAILKNNTDIINESEAFVASHVEDSIRPKCMLRKGTYEARLRSRLWLLHNVWKIFLNEKRKFVMIFFSVFSAGTSTNVPRGVTEYNGYLYFLDSETGDRLFRIDLNGNDTTPQPVPYTVDSGGIDDRSLDLVIYDSGKFRKCRLIMIM